MVELPVTASPAVGDLIDSKYEIVRMIGEGAWGDVFEGVNVRIKRRVAIKVLKADYAKEAAMVTRFEREAMTATQIESPYVVHVYDAGVLADGRPYLVMEYLTGEDLAIRLQKSGGRIDEIQAAIYCMQGARGLAVAHAVGVLHRDIKPDNIFLSKGRGGEETAKIVDFGISKLLAPGTEMHSKTQTGFVLGSPVYMSPEQARGSKESDHRSDIFSLGVVLFECLVGRPPFDAETFNELMFKIALEQAPDVRTIRPEIDEGLAAIVGMALAKEPRDRYPTAGDFERALMSWLEARGAPTGEWRTASGPRPTELQKYSSSGGMPAALAVEARTTGGQAGALRDPRAATANTDPAPALETSPPKKKLPVVPLVLGGVLLLGGVGFALSRGGEKGSFGPEVVAKGASTAPSPTTSPSETVPSVPEAAATVASSQAAASSTATPISLPAASASGAPGVKKGSHRTTTPAQASATSTASSVASTPSAAGTAAVGGRTIHTNL